MAALVIASVNGPSYSRLLLACDVTNPPECEIQHSGDSVIFGTLSNANRK
jgi:hypothetical protein